MKPDANQKPKSKSNNLAMALQSRLNKAASGANPDQNDDRQSMDRQSMERPYHKPSYKHNNTYDKHRQRYNQHHNKDNNKRSRSRSKSHHYDRYNKQKHFHDRNKRYFLLTVTYKSTYSSVNLKLNYSIVATFYKTNFKIFTMLFALFFLETLNIVIL